MGRSKKIFDRITAVIGEVHDVDDSLIYQLMTDTETDVAEEFNCIESSDTLTIIASTATYDEPTGFRRLKVLALSSGLVIQPKEVDKLEMDNIQKISPFIGIGVIYYTRWNGQITFYPTPSASDTYTLYYFAVPTATLSQSSEPQTPATFDKCIWYGTLVDLLPIIGKADQMPLYLSLYNQERERALRSWRGTKTVSLELVPQEL